MIGSKEDIWRLSFLYGEGIFLKSVRFSILVCLTLDRGDEPVLPFSMKGNIGSEPLEGVDGSTLMNSMTGKTN